jgi:hypothetical protein
MRGGPASGDPIQASGSGRDFALDERGERLDHAPVVVEQVLARREPGRELPAALRVAAQGDGDPDVIVGIARAQLVQADSGASGRPIGARA